MDQSNQVEPESAETQQRQEILSAAAICFSVQGVDPTSVDDIARELGATKGKIYYHFRTKREVVLQVWNHSVYLTISGADAAVRPDQTPTQKLYAISFAHAMSMMTDQQFHRTAIECMRRPPLQVSSEPERALAVQIRTLQKEYENRFRTVIKEGIRRGEFRNENVSLSVHSVISLLHAPAHWYAAPDGDAQAMRINTATDMARMAVGCLSSASTRYMPFRRSRDFR